MTALVWRKEPPDKPGFYWVRRHGRLSVFECRIRRSPEGDYEGPYWCSGKWHDRVGRMKWENAGPIPEPEEEETE